MQRRRILRRANDLHRRHSFDEDCARRNLRSGCCRHQVQDRRRYVLRTERKKHTLTAPAEAIELANDTAYGLAAAVFTQNIKRGLKVAHSLEAGTAFVRINRRSTDASADRDRACAVYRSTVTTR